MRKFLCAHITDTELLTFSSARPFFLILDQQSHNDSTLKSIKIAHTNVEDLNYSKSFESDVLFKIPNSNP